jgi:beta-fructofuranosidase
MLDPKGRRIMWAWVFDQSDQATQKAGGWSGVFGPPRELWLGEDHRLRMRPVEELKALRYNQRAHSQLRLSPNEERLVENIQGNVLDLELVLEPFGANRCGIKVCCAPDGSEETIVGYDRVARTIYIDTQCSSSSGMGLKTVEAGPFHLADTELLTLRILIDKSVVEVYANERQAALRRIYPSHPDSLQLKLFCEGGAMHVQRLTAWEMMPSNPY